MIKENINTFSGGVNFDLDPITTPPNILTDTVNGTFITFNGDELALQNDSGNTTIDYLGNPVRLSPGFYPIGIKEYGGILYIVSAKYPTIYTVEFDDEDSYDQGEVVYKTVSGIKYYYESLLDDNNETLPSQSNEYWLYIGLEKDFINKYGFVEFGSYPSPETLDPNLNDESVNYQVENWPYSSPEQFKLSLYSPKIINNSLFRAGNYINFHTVNLSPLDTTNISFQAFNYINSTGRFIKEDSLSEKKIYKVKLYHQLTNGIIDLTDDVWEKFAGHVYTEYSEELNSSGSPRFWFNDATFKYYCPHNFKGKLMISIELEEFDDFSLVDTNVIYDLTNYNVTFNVDSIETAGWDNSLFATICYTLNGDEPNFDTLTSTNIIATHRSLPSFTVIRPGSDAGKIMKYKIRPDFYFGGSTISYSDFPQQFLDAHTISGVLSISSQEEEYVISIDPTSYIPDVLDPTARIATRLVLKNIAGEYLANDFTVSVNPYYFYLSGTTAPHPLGVFTVGSDFKADLQSWNLTYPITPSNYQNYIKSLVENTVVYEPFVYYGRVTLTVTVNKTFGNNSPIRVYQGGVLQMNSIPSYGPTYTFSVKSGVAFTIVQNSGLGLDMNTDYNYTGTITSDTEITFGLITKLTITEQVLIDEFYDTLNFLHTDVSISNFGPMINPARFTLVQTDPNFGSATISEGIVSGDSNKIFEFTSGSGHFPEYTLTFSNLTSNIYDNLTGLDLALENDHLFLKEHTGLTAY